MSTIEKHKKMQKQNDFSAFYRLLPMQPGYQNDYAKELKETLVKSFSGGRTASLRTIAHLYPAEYFQLLEYMKLCSGKQGAYSRDGEKWRRRVLAAICSYLDDQDYKFDTKQKKLSYAISIACRSAGCDRFNSIPVPALRKVYNTFSKKHLVETDSKGYMGYTVKEWSEAVATALKNNGIKINE